MIPPTTETIRAQYKPDRVRVLFVGESPPAGGTFFYVGNSRLFKYTFAAFEEATGQTWPGPEAFLNWFCAQGFYLDDLCLEPVNHVDKKLRKQAQQQGIEPLATRIRSYQPDTIIVVMKAIKECVEEAARRAEYTLTPVALPFPAQGNEVRYRTELADALRTIAAKA